MPENAIPRYQTTYRNDEIQHIIRLAKRGQSLALVGVAGVGKSNIINFLRDIHHNAPQIEEDVASLHFAIVDATQWQGQPNSLWKMMGEALQQATKELPAASDAQKIIPISEDERTFKVVQERLAWVCQELGHQVMFVLDDFDRVLESGPLDMLERLNGLRSEGNREQLSYLLFTKQLPHILGWRYDLGNRSKFYDLFSHNIYALQPYRQNDAMRMLQHLNELADQPLTKQQLEHIYQMAGGHARLLKVVFDIWVEEGASGVKVTYFAEKPDVQHECRRILHSLHQPEQEVALAAAQGSLQPGHQDLLEHLVRRGLLEKIEPVTWFSPVMAHFLSQYQP